MYPYLTNSKNNICVLKAIKMGHHKNVSRCEVLLKFMHSPYTKIDFMIESMDEFWNGNKTRALDASTMNNI